MLRGEKLELHCRLSSRMEAFFNSPHRRSKLPQKLSLLGRGICSSKRRLELKEWCSERSSQQARREESCKTASEVSPIDQGIKESPLWRCGSDLVLGFNLPMCSLNFFLCSAYGFNFSKGARKDGGHAAARGNEAKREEDSGQLGPIGARRAPKLRAEPPAHPPTLAFPRRPPSHHGG